MKSTLQTSMNPSNDKIKHQNYHNNHLQPSNKNDYSSSSLTFNYIYTCDIEDVCFRVKIVNLDGILPPHGKNSSHSQQQQQQNESKSSPSYSFTTVHNHYEYNIIEDDSNFGFIDSLIDLDIDGDSNNSQDSDGVDRSIGADSADTDVMTSGIDSDEYRKHGSQSSYSNDKELSLKDRKKKQLNDIIFGNLNQPFRALSNHPYLTCDLVSNGRRLCPPQQTQYRHMINRYEWNEWLQFSLTIDTLPRDTIICFTIWDIVYPNKTAAVARTSMKLFSKRGCLRKGLYDLRLFFNEDCYDYYRDIISDNCKEKNCQQQTDLTQTQLQQPLSTITNDIITSDILLSDINLSNRIHCRRELVLSEQELLPKLRKHLNIEQTKDSQLFHFNNNNDFNNRNRFHYRHQQNKFKNFHPHQLEFTSTQQYYEQDLSVYPLGTGDKSKKIQRFNKLKKRYYNNQLPKRESQDRRVFAEIEKQTVAEKSLSTFVYLTIEFPIILMDGIEHTAVYFEDKDDQCCQYDLIDKDIVTIQDPEMNLSNLVEIKHHALARSARSGISLRDLKPNATIRNQLNAIVNYPSTQPLTSEEQDLIWKYRFYLRNQKKALTKFLKTVNWQAIAEAEQAIELLYEWSCMDIDDALELLSPYFTHPAVRKYAVGRLKEASDDDLLLYLLQLVQALKYENFNEIRQSYENELLEYQKLQREKKSHHPDSVSLSSAASTTPDTLIPESQSIFVSTSATNTTNDRIADDKSSLKSPIRSDNSAKQRRNVVATPNEDDLATFLLDRVCQNDELANYFFWYLYVECESAKSFGSTSASLPQSAVTNVDQSKSSSAQIFSSVATNSYLVQPPSTPQSSSSLTANGLELENALQQQQQKHSKISTTSSVNELIGSYSITNVIDMYMIMMRRFSTKLLTGGTPEMLFRRQFLLRQQDFVVKLVEIMKEIARESGNRMKKIEKLQSILESPEPQFRFDFNINDPLPLPLNPNVKIIGVAAKEAMLYKSATMPAKLGFITDTGQIFWTIFKNGDDLRQDDLVLQMINLMDKLLRKENLDLKLTPYRVLACSSKHGFVQFIDSLSIAEIISTEGTIQNYLRKISNLNSQTPTITSTSSIHDFQVISTGSSASMKSQKTNAMVTTGSPSSSSSSSSQSSLAAAISPSGSSSNQNNGISSDVMDAYIKSCAGYCVITYLLGVGDRHLDNLLMTKNGRLFHIDFGFILGRDPKLRPPPMKITREMVDAMGGMDSENFHKFCTFVRTAFLHLRRHSNLILNLFSLMIDANVPDIALEPDKTVQKIQDKFKLELSDEQADHYITEQVEQSVRSIMPVVVDQLHKMTQYLRN